MRYRLTLLAPIVALWLGAAPAAEAADDPSVPRPGLGQRLGRLLGRDATPAPVPPPPIDPSVLRTQIDRLPEALPPTPGVLRLPPTPAPGLGSSGDFAAGAAPAVGGQSLSLEAALFGALTANPDLVSLRQGGGIANAPSPEAVEVARRFPTTLNPTLWVDYRPYTQIQNDPIGPNPGGRNGYRTGDQFLYISLRQPLELGRQTRHRFDIARAALDQQNWTIMQAELTALVQTYGFFQTAAYRREKLRIAAELADFNERLLETLQLRLDANQVPAADVVLGRVETRASRQLVKVARQDYLTAIADLNIQVGRTEAEGAAEPLGEFALPPYIPPVEEEAMIRTALENRPDIHAARAQLKGAESAIRLARADRIPSPIVGPEYQRNEAGASFVGFVYITPIPIVNNGTPLVRQREAEARRAAVVLQQAQQRAVAQVRAAVVRWNGATDLVSETSGLTEELAGEVVKLERLFDEGDADLTVLLQGRQRLIQLENSRLDAVWAATQAQADLLLALGTPTLINAMLAGAGADAASPIPSAPSIAQPASDAEPGSR